MVRRSRDPASHIARINKEIRLLQAKCSDLLNKWAVANCPFKIGDVVTTPVRVCSQQAVVEEIQGLYSAGCYWRLRVRIIDKDGRTTKQTAIFTQHDWESAAKSRKIGA